jgi:ribosomal protein S27AE
MDIDEAGDDELIYHVVDDSPSAEFNSCPECGTTKIMIPNLQLRFSTCCGRCMSVERRESWRTDTSGHRTQHQADYYVWLINCPYELILCFFLYSLCFFFFFFLFAGVLPV